MKELYFSPTNIKEKSQELFRFLDQTRHRTLDRFDPSHSALLILDMQEYFLNPGSHAYIPSAISILPGLQSLLEVYSTHSLPIIFTRHLNTSQDAANMRTWWRELLTVDNPFSRITQDLDQTLGVTIIKTQYDAFFKTDLEKLLISKEITQVVICGVMTHLCCETTARNAFMHGYNVFFSIDGCATYTESHHRASLINLAHGFAVPVLVQEIIDRIQSIS